MTARPTGGIRVVFSSPEGSVCQKLDFEWWMKTVTHTEREWEGRKPEKERDRESRACTCCVAIALPLGPLDFPDWQPVASSSSFSSSFSVSRRRPWWNRLSASVLVYPCALAPSLSSAGKPSKVSRCGFFIKKFSSVNFDESNNEWNFPNSTCRVWVFFD